MMNEHRPPLISPLQALQRYGTPYVSHQAIRTLIGFGTPILDSKGGKIVAWDLSNLDIDGSLHMDFRPYCSHLPRDFKKIFESVVVRTIPGNLSRMIASRELPGPTSESLDRIAELIERLFIPALPGPTRDPQADREIPGHLRGERPVFRPLDSSSAWSEVPDDEPVHMIDQNCPYDCFVLTATTMMSGITKENYEQYHDRSAGNETDSEIFESMVKEIGAEKLHDQLPIVLAEFIEHLGRCAYDVLNKNHAASDVNRAGIKFARTMLAAALKYAER